MYDEEIEDEIVECKTISDLDVIATYKIKIDQQELFDQHGVSRTAGSNENARHEMIHDSRMTYIILLLLTHVKI